MQELDLLEFGLKSIHGCHSDQHDQPAIDRQRGRSL